MHLYIVTLLAKLTQIWVIWGCWDEVMMVDIVEAVQLPSLFFQTHIVYIGSVSAYSYAVDRHIGEGETKIMNKEGLGRCLKCH